MANHLYCGDNLEVLRSEIKDETVDLVYLDPPFNSNATYNVLFRGPSGNGQAGRRVHCDAPSACPASPNGMRRDGRLLPKSCCVIRK